MNGEGTLEFYDGKVFVGTMKEHGMLSGTLTYPTNTPNNNKQAENGVIDESELSSLLKSKWAEYKGEFKDNLPHSSSATLRFTNGDEYFGDFEKGKMNGAGKFRLAKPLLLKDSEEAKSKKRRMIVSWFGEVQGNELQGLVRVFIREEEEKGQGATMKVVSTEKRCIMLFDAGKLVKIQAY